MKPIPEVEAELDERLDALGMELVEAEWAGNARRPILRLRVDFPDSVPGEGVTVGDCARVSRILEAWLDDLPAIPEKYVLEVSSPGVERPLRTRRDFARFAGHEVAMKIGAPGSREYSSSVEGLLEGIEEEGEGFRVVIRTEDGSRAAIPRDEVRRAHLVFRWGEQD